MKTPRRREPPHSPTKFRRRGLIIGGAQLAFMGVLGLQMRRMQLEEADQFRLLAEENRINVRLIPPARGEIFDRNGTLIAENVPSYRITMVKEDAGDVGEVIERLSSLIDLDPNDVNRALQEMDRIRPFLPVTLTDDLTWEEISRISVNAPALPGITAELGLSRRYPLGDAFAHIVGYVGPVSDYDLSKIDNPDQLLRIPRYQIGKVGIEAKREDMLRGKAGTKRVEVNAIGRVMRELDRNEGQAGATLQLTVDYDLQNYAQTRLGNESASAVVIDCEKGDVLAIASSPTYDPNLFVRGISVADYKTLTDNKYRPLASKTVQGLYPPGSTFKMVTALAGLDAGIISPQDTVYCSGHTEVAFRKFHCWKRSGHGHMNLQTALRESCDVYFYDLALKIGIEKISAIAHKLGLGERFDLPMSAVAAGRAPTKDWKKQSFGKDWVLGDTVNASIGQGFVLSSPLQLAVMTARLATGRSVTPRLIRTRDGVPEPSGAGTELDIDPTYLREVRKGMFAVSNNRKGTAYKTRIVADGYKMAGKTGTSQVRNITEAERRRGVIRNEDLSWERRDHALYVDFAPYDNPKVAVAVVVEHGGGGSKAAAPIARDVTLQALYGGFPPINAYPGPAQANAKATQNRIKRELRAREDALKVIVQDS